MPVRFVYIVWALYALHDTNRNSSVPQNTCTSLRMKENGENVYNDTGWTKVNVCMTNWLAVYDMENNKFDVGVFAFASV